MLGNIRERFNKLINKMDGQIVGISFITMLAICYFVNPLDNVGLINWNRTFCSAIFAGISIDKRIAHFYLFFLVIAPIVFFTVLLIYNWLFDIREKCKETFLKINIMTLFSILAAYLSRYESGSYLAKDNLLLSWILLFYFILGITCLIDNNQTLKFADHVTLFVAYSIAVISTNILFDTKLYIIYGVLAVVMIFYVIIITHVSFGTKYKKEITNFLCLLMWSPAVVRLLLEGIYFMTEKGNSIQKYYTFIVSMLFAFFVVAAAIVIVFKRKAIDLSGIGFTGAIVSLGAISFFQYTYQYVWSYTNIPNIYEFGNPSVAMDTILYGKLPIIDNFSAHALNDVWTRILYGLMHSDIKGIFVDPYGGISTILAYLCLFYIVKNLFDKYIAVLFVLLFPFSIVGIKFTSICCFSMVMLIYIVKKPELKSFILYWIVVLICAFTTYDEGILLGVASIFANVLLLVIQKRWKKLKEFIIAGGIVGFCAILTYMIYAIATGIDVLSRLKEWLSVSVGSNSSWATENFGEASTLAFLVAYYIVPSCAMIIFAVTFYKFLKTKQQLVLAAITMGFSITELLYIPRTIVYHNLAVCSGMTGVLLNFIHWSVALFILFNLSLKEQNIHRKLFSWISTLGIVIIFEGALVTGQLPGTNSVLYAKAVSASENWALRDDITENWDQERIIFDDATNKFIGQFNTVFDTLLTENQTFIDFADVTSLYALTGRKRPFYVGQSPSLLTDLYSQECYLNELAKYDCPLAVMGITETNYLQQMVGIPHNIRYYKVAEYIYNNYRPLINFGEFSIWCEKNLREKYMEKLSCIELDEMGYTLVDYGYDATTTYTDGGGNVQYAYQPYHQYGLNMIPYIWANYDEYNAVNNLVLTELQKIDANAFVFEGSQYILKADGNYLLLKCTNPNQEDILVTVTFRDSSNEGARYEYSFTVEPGTKEYMIRASQDYFWHAYNINTVSIVSDSQVYVENAKILKGD